MLCVSELFQRPGSTVNVSKGRMLGHIVKSASKTADACANEAAADNTTHSVL